MSEEGLNLKFRIVRSRSAKFNSTQGSICGLISKNKGLKTLSKNNCTTKKAKKDCITSKETMHSLNQKLVMFRSLEYLNLLYKVKTKLEEEFMRKKKKRKKHHSSTKNKLNLNLYYKRRMKLHPKKMSNNL